MNTDTFKAVKEATQTFLLLVVYINFQIVPKKDLIRYLQNKISEWKREKNEAVYFKD